MIHAFFHSLTCLRIDKLCCSNSRNHTYNSNSVIDTIMQRACRTSAGIDSYFKVQELFCVPGTPLLCPFVLGYSLTRCIGTFLSHRTGEDPPTIVDVFMDSNCNLVARLEVRNSFALYDNSTMDEINGDGSMEPPPLLIIDTVIAAHSSITSNTHSLYH